MPVVAHPLNWIKAALRQKSIAGLRTYTRGFCSERHPVDNLETKSNIFLPGDYYICSLLQCILVACSHFLTLKLNEAWYEAEVQSPELVPDDEEILSEFLQVGQ